MHGVHIKITPDDHDCPLGCVCMSVDKHPRLRNQVDLKMQVPSIRWYVSARPYDVISQCHTSQRPNLKKWAERFVEVDGAGCGSFSVLKLLYCLFVCLFLSKSYLSYHLKCILRANLNA